MDEPVTYQPESTTTLNLRDLPAEARPSREKPEVVDRYGRRLSYLRVSVTDLCNLSCTYCNPVKGCAVTHPHKLSWDGLAFLVDVGVHDLGVEAIRITGGEPTIRPGLIDWVHRINEFGLRDIAMTTNGILLGTMAKPLKAAGLRRVNVSLDTFDADQYREVTRGGSLERCLEGIEVARETFERVKINVVLLRGFNDHQIPDFVAFSERTGIEVRFIELMPIFGEKEYFHRHFISVAEVQKNLARQGCMLDADRGSNRTGYGPATTYKVRGSRARLGFISQMSDTKCLSCNKLRLTSDGALKPCLLSPKEIDVAPAIEARDRRAVADALRHQFLIRAERYDALEALNDPFQRSMQAIGG